MFISNYNLLACQFLDSFNFETAPAISLLVGETGLGKTTFLKHLFKKAENQVDHPLFIDAQKFASKYAFAASDGELSSLRKYFRSSKFFVLDNINLLEGKTKTIEELFHTLETILTHGGKTVISYDGNALSLDFLGKRLASRLRSGMIIRLQQPTPKEINDFMEYYLRKLDLLNQIGAVEVSKAVTIQEAIRIVDCVLKGTASDDELKENNDTRLKKDFKTVLPLVSEHYLVDPQEVLGNSKKAKHVQARYMVYLVLHEQFAYTYSEICHLVKKNVHDLERRCLKIKEGNRDLFETLCQKLYN